MSEMVRLINGTPRNCEGLVGESFRAYINPGDDAVKAERAAAVP